MTLARAKQSRRNIGSIAVLITMSATLAMAAVPDEAIVQGLYEGTWKDAAGAFPAEVRVVALGSRKFSLLARRKLADGTIDRAEIPGLIEGETVAFSGPVGGAACRAAYADGAIKGSIGAAGSLEIRRIERKPPSLGKKPPAGAVVLLDGRKFDELERTGGVPWHVGDMSKNGWPVWEIGLQFSGAEEPAAWPTPQNPLPAGWVIVPTRRKVETVVGIGEDGSMIVPKHGVWSTRAFGDSSYDMHIEFMCDFNPGARSQVRSNSGVFLPRVSEIQVLDSFGMETEHQKGCGAVYGKKEPDCMEPILSLHEPQDSRCERAYTLASLPPLQWQTYDVEFRVKKNDKGQPDSFFTLFHNGIKVHDALSTGDPRQTTFKFHIQDHGCCVRYRNIWYVPVGP